MNPQARLRAGPGLEQVQARGGLAIGVAGGLVQMIAHGFVSGAMFLS